MRNIFFNRQNLYPSELDNKTSGFHPGHVVFHHWPNSKEISFFDPVRSAGLTPVPSTGATGQAGQARYTLQR